MLQNQNQMETQEITWIEGYIVEITNSDIIWVANPIHLLNAIHAHTKPTG